MAGALDTAVRRHFEFTTDQSGVVTIRFQARQGDSGTYDAMLAGLEVCTFFLTSGRISMMLPPPAPAMIPTLLSIYSNIDWAILAQVVMCEVLHSPCIMPAALQPLTQTLQGCVRQKYRASTESSALCRFTLRWRPQAALLLRLIWPQPQQAAMQPHQ